MFPSHSSRCSSAKPPRSEPILLPEVALASEPLYQGEPIVAVAAIDEVTAADAIEKIKVEYEPLPFVVDPILTLRPGGPNPRAEGNVWRPPQVQEMKISEAEVAELDAGRVPLLENTPIRWEVGDVDAGFKNADYILDETLVHQSTGHQPMEPRTAMAYWQNGKLYLHGSTQSVARTVANVAQWVDIPQDQVVVISEYTGGGFGGKIPGAQTMAIPAILSKKTGRPVMMRITREEENYIGRARAGIHLRAKIGFRKDGRIWRWTCARSETAGRTPIRAMSARWAETPRRCTTPKVSGSAASPCSPTRRRACRSARREANRPLRCSSR